MPLCYRRVSIAMWYLQYLALLGEDHTVCLAQMDVFNLDRNEYPSWAGDMHYVLAHLLCPVAVALWTDDDLACPIWHGTIQDKVRQSCEDYLRTECMTS